MASPEQIAQVFKERGWHQHPDEEGGDFWQYGRCSARCKRGDTWPEHLWAYAEDSERGVWKATLSLGDDAATMHYGDLFGLIQMFEAEANRRNEKQASQPEEPE